MSDLPDKNDSHSLTRSLVFAFHTFYIISLTQGASTTTTASTSIAGGGAAATIKDKQEEVFLHGILAINYCDYR